MYTVIIFANQQTVRVTRARVDIEQTKKKKTTRQERISNYQRCDRRPLETIWQPDRLSYITQF